jgi:Carboxypeptidase regulatory-like domain
MELRKRNGIGGMKSAQLAKSLLALMLGIAALVFPRALFAQAGGTGALTGTIKDPSGAVIVGAQITVTNEGSGDVRELTSNGDGIYLVSLLPPGNYSLKVSKAGFEVSTFEHVAVVVSETATLNLQVKVGTAQETVVINASEELLQTESPELGSVTDSTFIEGLPLVTRNYEQIVGLNPGVSTEVTNAGDLGRGNESFNAGSAGFSANGSTTIDNNIQMNGVEVNDLGAALNFTGGAPVPNPDTIQEFKVVTQPYDATNGRNGGANVDLVTKSGTNQFHGSLFEFLRNEDLNANSYQNNLAGQPRGILRENQFGGTVGGPIIKNKLLVFGSYQGTRQENGISGGCATTLNLPPLTNDRSAAAIGAIFAGQRGEIQDELGGVGPAVAANGSNINPVALKILQAKLPNGSYLIPTPQTIVNGQGTSTISQACPFTENQYMVNADYLHTSGSKFAFRYFHENGTSTQTLPGNPQGGETPLGFPWSNLAAFDEASVTHTFTISSNIVNQLQVAYDRSYAVVAQTEPFTWSDFGANVPAELNNFPNILIGSLGLGGNGEGSTLVQNTFIVEDTISHVIGRHTLRYGGGIERPQVNISNFHTYSGADFQSFPDFLLGLSGQANGTAAACGCGGFPNDVVSTYLIGDLGRGYRVFDANMFLQDDFKVTSKFTFNIGLRYERIGTFNDIEGRNTSFWPQLANPNPPASGSLQGWTVPSNYTGPVPSGVTRVGNDSGTEALGQNTWNPRVGFAWQLPWTNRFVLRGGYGIFRSRSTAGVQIQSLVGQPFGFFQQATIPTVTLQQPFPALPPFQPSFVPYSDSTQQGFEGFAPTFKPPVVQHYSMDLQTQLAGNYLLDIGYVGTRSTRLPELLAFDQAELASAADPIRGQTTNTIANIPLREPIPGFVPSGTLLVASAGGAWYNALQVSLNKHYSNGLQFLASYTFARDLTDTNGYTTGNLGGNVINGNQFEPHQNYGPETFIREHRFIGSYVYNFPHPQDLNSFKGRAIGGWAVGGVTTIQSGHPLEITYTNQLNVYGIFYDRPNYVPGCKVSTSGSLETRVVNGYLNAKCFTPPPVIGADGVGTAFGDAPIGMVDGPDQVNFDFSIIKDTRIAWPTEVTNLEFRAELFNAFNHPQFADPITDYLYNTIGLFGVNPGGQTVVSPRVVQFALKFSF